MIFGCLSSMDPSNADFFGSLDSGCTFRDSDMFESRSDSVSSDFASPPPNTSSATPTTSGGPAISSAFGSSFSMSQHDFSGSELNGTTCGGLSNDEYDSGCKSKQTVANYGDKESEEYRIKRRRNNEAVKKARKKFNEKNSQAQKRLEVLRSEHEVLVLKRNQIRSNYELIKSVYEDAVRAVQETGSAPSAAQMPDLHNTSGAAPSPFDFHSM